MNKQIIGKYLMEDSGIVTASDIVWFMVSNTESAEQETTDWTFSESLILLSFCFIYVRRCHLFQTEMTLTVISGTYQKVLLISRKYCTNISCTLIFLGFVFESGNCVVVCVVLKLKSEKVFWDAILKFILITKLL